jgi:hypothetical protein
VIGNDRLEGRGEQSILYHIISHNCMASYTYIHNYIESS